jgi:hypothetical protein
MKKIVIEEEGRKVEATVNRYDRIINIRETLDEDVETITLTFNEYYQLFHLLADRLDKAAVS